MNRICSQLPFLITLLLGALGSFRAAAQAPNSAWVYPSATGNLLYQLDERAQRIADFSQCGYRGGTEPLPNVSVLIPQDRWVYVSPGAGDDKALIQAAIETVKAFTPDANGWRGVVYLNAGEYQLATTLTMNSAGGVVLKGAGDDPVTGTRLRATGTVQYDLISANGSGGRTTVADTTHNLTQKLVPAGTRTFEVDSTSGLAVGHTVIVKRPSTTNWIAAIDMDQLTEPWTEGSKDLLFDRVVTRIDGNWITVDAPLPQTFESQYGGGQIWRYTWSGRMQQVGIEDIYAFSDYASPTDENHAWNFIYMSRTEHGWVRNITAQYFALSAVWLGTDGKYITVADSQCLDPISQITGGRRYPFQTTESELTLFVNNYARNGRHDFSFGATVAGPNAFVHGTGDTALNDTGPHQRWAVGGLFDLITINGDEINVRNRGNSGTGHGWAGAYMAVWNCKASGFRVRNPPTARNWLVGSIGPIGASSGFSVGADPPGTYDSSGPSGTGKAVHPRSLYYGQLQQRMKWLDSEFREVWLGDVDQHFSTGGTGNTVSCDTAWLTQVEALGALPADAKFDYLVGNRHTACTLDFPLDPGDTIVAASLTVSLRGITNADADSIWLDSTTSPQSYTSLGWTPISTTAPTVRTMEVTPALLADGRLNLAFGTNSAVDFAVLHLHVQKVQRSTQTITLTPVADAYVQSGVNAGTNYGTATNLVTKNDTSPDLNRETFLRWDLSSVSGKIVRARVRLAGTGTGQIGNESCATFVSDDTWGETTVTYTNKPAAGKLFAQWLPVAGQPVEFTVTPQVVDTLLGDGELSLRILSTDNYGAAGTVTYASRENSTAANRPQLILTIENPPTAAIKAATGSALNLGTAWTGGLVPVNPDTATWNATSLAGAMTLGADLSWAGLIVSNPAGPLTFNGTQTLILDSAGIDMSASTVNLTLNHPVFLGEDQTWNVGAARTLAANGQISGARSLTKTGTGNLILSGASSFSGNVTISTGPATITNSLGLGTGAKTINASNGTAGACELHLDGVTGPIALPADMSFNTSRATGNGAIVNDAGNNSIAGPISMIGGGGNTLVTVLGGSLALNGNITANVSTGRTLQLAGTGSNAVNGIIQDGSGVASVTVQSGTWTLSNTNTNTGANIVSGGTLALSGSLAGPLTVNGGTFAPRGLPATGSALTLVAGGAFQPRINGTTAGMQYDQLATGGTVALGGSLDLVAGPGLGAGASFRILNKTSAGAISGTFAGKPEGSAFTDDGYTWIISYLGGDGNDVVLALATPSQSWRFAYFGTTANSGAAADLADPDNDSIENLLERALGLNPNSASTTGLPTASWTEIGLEDYLTLTVIKSPTASDLTYTVEVSNDLTLWNSGPTHTTILDNTATLLRVRDNTPLSSGARRFIHLKVTQP